MRVGGVNPGLAHVTLPLSTLGCTKGLATHHCVQVCYNYTSWQTSCVDELGRICLEIKYFLRDVEVLMKRLVALIMSTIYTTFLQSSFIALRSYSFVCVRRGGASYILSSSKSVVINTGGAGHVLVKHIVCTKQTVQNVDIKQC